MFTYIYIYIYIYTHTHNYIHSCCVFKCWFVYCVLVIGGDLNIVRKHPRVRTRGTAREQHSREQNGHNLITNVANRSRTLDEDREPFANCSWRGSMSLQTPFRSLLHFSICACHPCAGATLVLVSFHV